MKAGTIGKIFSNHDSDGSDPCHQANKHFKNDDRRNEVSLSSTLRNHMIYDTWV